MKVYSLVVFILFLSAGKLAAQDEQFPEPEQSRPALSERLYVGGGLGFSLGNNVTTIAVSPFVGYLFSQRFSMGLGGTYQRSSSSFSDITIQNYGFRLFGRFSVTEEIFGYSEVERLNFQYINQRGATSTDTYDALYLGIGYQTRVTMRTSFFMIALYDLNHNVAFSPYPSPLQFRTGILVSLR